MRKMKGKQSLTGSRLGVEAESGECIDIMLLKLHFHHDRCILLHTAKFHSPSSFVISPMRLNSLRSDSTTSLCFPLPQVPAIVSTWHFLIQLLSSIHIIGPHQRSLPSSTQHLMHLMPFLSTHLHQCMHTNVTHLPTHTGIIFSNLYMSSAFRAYTLQPCLYH